MGAYIDSRTCRAYIEFRMHGVTYKKRFAAGITLEQAEHFERQWRASITDERIKKGLDVCYDTPTSSQTGNNLVVSKRSTKRILYIVRTGDNYKIGVTDNFERRFRALTGGTPHGLETILVLRSPDADALEKALHTLFRARNVRGEWFKLNEKDLRVVTALAGVKVVLNRCCASMVPPAADEKRPKSFVSNN